MSSAANDFDAASDALFAMLDGLVDEDMSEDELTVVHAMAKKDDFRRDMRSVLTPQGIKMFKSDPMFCDFVLTVL